MEPFSLTYRKAKAYLGSYDSLNLNRIIGGRKGNTWLERRDGGIALRLYQTDIVLFTPHYIELNTGGWPTKMTTEAMSAFSPIRIYSAGASGLCFKLAGEDWHSDGHPFYDGIRISTDGARLMRSQPNRPESHEPLLMESGFTRTPYVGSRAR